MCQAVILHSVAAGLTGTFNVPDKFKVEGHPTDMCLTANFTLLEPVWQAPMCLTNLKFKDIPGNVPVRQTSPCGNLSGRHLNVPDKSKVSGNPLDMCLVPGGQSARHSCLPSCKRMPRTCRTGELAGLFEGKTILLTMLSLSQLMLSKWSPNLNHSCANI